MTITLSHHLSNPENFLTFHGYYICKNPQGAHISKRFSIDVFLSQRDDLLSTSLGSASLAFIGHGEFTKFQFKNFISDSWESDGKFFIDGGMVATETDDE